MSYRALIIDDSPLSVESLEAKVRSLSHELLSVNDQQAAYRILETETFDYALVDIRLKINPRDSEPDEEVGFATMRHIHEHYPSVKIIAVTAYDEQHETTVRATQCGADNFWSKNPDRNLEKLQTKILKLFASLENLEKTADLTNSTDKAKKVKLKSQLSGHNTLNQVDDLVAQLAPLDVTILLLGEPGTGKEFYANKIRELSLRRKKPFDTINCGNLNTIMLQSELFGHKKGSFTGATSDRDGAAKSLNGGTLFMDEIGTIPLECQKQILRFIELKEIQPVGADRTETVDVRIIAATNQDLKASVDIGEFRADLRDRLSGYVIELPPLRNRGQAEILRLAQFFYQEYRKMHKNKSGLTDIRIARGTLEELSRMDYNWPANVRELKHLIERTMNLRRGRQIGIQDFIGQMKAVKQSKRVQISGVTQVNERDQQAGQTAKLSEREEFVLNLIREKRSVRRKQVQESLGVKTTVTCNLLKGMIDKGLIHQEGIGRDVRYVLS